MNNVSVNGHNVPFSKSIKYLGLYSDNSLNWNGHVRQMKNIIMPVVWHFSEIRHWLNQCTAILYYTALIRPLLEYASAAFHNMSATNSHILEVIQNKCLRIITQTPSRTHSQQLRDQLNIPAITNRRTYLYLCQFYKLYKII